MEVGGEEELVAAAGCLGGCLGAFGVKSGGL